ncbi:hypothetical protein CANINC_000034 [Pichia inconspicua]|uniref:FAD-binding FR-type domain-containing protein n=1 Tax=Pichia inconspicua TaxID=52247 RepID=A0A4T0X7P8_9ASCO|nr:hypothetical protein CANINC_000034 [[Candida] inconspicua]
MNISALVQILLLSVCAEAAAGWTRYSEGYYISAGCKKGIGKVANFCGDAKTSGTTKCLCKNEYALATWLNCGYSIWPKSEESFRKQIIEECGAKPKTAITEEHLDKVWSEYSSQVVNIDSLKSFNKTSPKYPVMSKALKKTAIGMYWGQKHRWGNVDVSHYLGIAFVAFAGLVFLLTAIINWMARMSRSFANQGQNKFQNAIRKHFTLGIFPRHLQSSKFGGGINPDKLETLYIAMMLLYSILANFILGFDWYVGDGQFKNKQSGMSRYYGDRSGILLSYQLPLLFIFPGRNNLFQYVTRWRQARFLSFHKWIARIVIAEVLIHSFAMASQYYADFGKFSKRMDEGYYRYGIVSTVFFCLFIPFTIGYLREHLYEVFLVIHIVLACFSIWTAYIHVAEMHYEPFYWACIAVWIFDRVARVARILLTGFSNKVEVEYFESNHSIKFTAKGGILKPYPGSHAYIHFLTPMLFWQSHPFTCMPSASQPGHVSFVCKVKGGITEKIANLCIANGGKYTMSVAIDGYYGEHSHYKFFDKSVFITGSTGISGPYYIAKDLCEKLPNHEVKLYWSVRYLQDIKAYLPELLTFKGTNVKPIIYVSNYDSTYASGSGSGSSDNENKESIDGTENKSDDDISEVVKHFEVHPGRIPVVEIIDKEMMESNESNGSVAFGLCAHPEVVDTARKHIANNLNVTSKRTEYFEEMQRW